MQSMGIEPPTSRLLSIALQLLRHQTKMVSPRVLRFGSDKWHIYSSEGSDISLELRAQLILHPHSVRMPPDGSNSLRPPLIENLLSLDGKSISSREWCWKIEPFV